MDHSLRISRLVNDYCSPNHGTIDHLVDCITRRKGGLEKKLGNLRSKQIISALEEKNFPVACKYLLEYYDKLYKSGKGNVIQIT